MENRRRANHVQISVGTQVYHESINVRLPAPSHFLLGPSHLLLLENFNRLMSEIWASPPCLQRLLSFLPAYIAYTCRSFPRCLQIVFLTPTLRTYRLTRADDWYHGVQRHHSFCAPARHHHAAMPRSSPRRHCLPSSSLPSFLLSAPSFFFFFFYALSFFFFFFFLFLPSSMDSTCPGQFTRRQSGARVCAVYSAAGPARRVRVVWRARACADSTAMRRVVHSGDALPLLFVALLDDIVHVRYC